jgi:hypothetical protein
MNAERIPECAFTKANHSGAEKHPPASGCKVSSFLPGTSRVGIEPPFLKAAVLLKSRNSKVRELQKTQVASHHLLLTALAL